jgi:hypothetical protein
MQLNPKHYLGKVDLDKTHTIQFRVLGKDEKSSGYKVGLDYLQLAQVLVEGAIEAENLKVVESKGGGVSTQAMGGFRGQWSEGAHLFFTPKEKGSFVTVEVPPTEKDGVYNLDVYYTTAPDYAIVELALDGQKTGAPTDCYATSVKPPIRVTYGPLSLKAGPHRLTFTALDKNPDSRGYYMGIDCLKFSPVGK